jgi:hypothetical protein
MSRRRAIGPAELLALIALVVALAGTSYAAVVVSGSDVRDGSLTGRDVKDRSLKRHDLSRNALPRGRRGPQGQPGPAGPAGPPGPSEVATTVGRNTQAGRGVFTEAVAIPVPGGAWLAAATVTLGNRDADPATVECSLAAEDGDKRSFGEGAATLPGDGTGAMSLHAAHDFGAAGRFVLRCRGAEDAAVEVRAPRLLVTRTGSVATVAPLQERTP